VRSPVLLLLLLLAAVVIAPAQESTVDFEGRVIGRVDFVPVAQPLPRAEMERLLSFGPGSKLSRADVRAAIERLYRTGRFADISVEATLENGQVAVRIVTEFNYFVSGVTINGVPEPPSRGQLTTATKIELGTAFADSAVKQASENIMDRLRANGLYQAIVDNSVERNAETEEAFLRFNVVPGVRARFDGAQFSNYKGPLEVMIRETRWHRGLGPIQFKGWREVTEKRVQTGVNRVLQYLQKGDHFEAQVDLDDLSYHAATNTVTPSLTIDSGPTLELGVTGAKISKGKLRQLIPIYQERAVDRSLLLEGQRNLVDYFQSQGYFAPAVEFAELEPEEGRQTIDYRITLNVRQKLVNVEISGNRYFDTPTLRERLAMTPAQFLRFRYGRYSQQLQDRDIGTIRDLYQSNGFRDADVIVRVDDNYKGQRGYISVSLQVKEGPQWLVGKLELQGVEPAEMSYVRSLLQSTEDQPFSEANIAADRDALLNYYYNNGYLDATFDWSETPGSAPNTLDLVYVLHPGRHEYVRTVLIRGLERTRRSLVEKRILLAPGDPISQSRLSETQQKLYDLGIFSRVETAIQNPDGEEEQKYVLIRMDEAGRYSFNGGVGAQLGRIGAGVTTFDEPAGTAGFSPRISLGITRYNLFGVANTVSLQTRFSTIEQRAVLNYLVPQLTGNDTFSLTTSVLFDNSRDIRTFAARRWEGSMQLAQRLSRANSMQYRFTFRHVSISDLVISPALVPTLSRPEQVGQFSMTFIQDRRDDPVNSHHGVYNTIDAGIALPQFGSETIAANGQPAEKLSFTRLLMRNSTYYSLSRNIVLARTLQFGYIQCLQCQGGASGIPLAERFYAGGAASNRAFPDNAAGPRDPETGFPVGGSALLIHSTELRFPLIGDNLGGVLFHDLGNVYDDVSDINARFRQRNLQDLDYMVQSVGFGIRYRTPIGPLRLDFSISPDAPRFVGFKGTIDQLIACGNACPLVTQKINLFQFHFSLGQTF
jgi:outer membrane protein assembly complex protein YaeT